MFTRFFRIDTAMPRYFRPGDKLSEHNSGVLIRIPFLVLAAINVSLVACYQDDGAGKSATIKTPATAAKAPAADQFGVPAPYTGKLNSLALINVRDAVLEQVLAPMDYPWTFGFSNEHEILLTRLSGQLLAINLTTKEKTVLDGLPAIGKGSAQIGLMDIELHPDFSTNQRIYFSYAKPHPESGKCNVTEVATVVLADGEITQLMTLINNQYFGWSPSNFGGASEFDDKGYL